MNPSGTTTLIIIIAPKTKLPFKKLSCMPCKLPLVVEITSLTVVGFSSNVNPLSSSCDNTCFVEHKKVIKTILL